MRASGLQIVAVAAALVVSASACQPPTAEKPPTVREGAAGSSAGSSSGSSTTSAAEPAPEPAAVALIEPGTRIDPNALPERTHLVFRSRPKLTSGDVDKVGKSIRTALENYTTLVLVETEPDPTKPGSHRRAGHKLGIGFPGEGGDVVITKETAKQYGAKLGLFERKVLAEREKELSTVRSPGASPTMAMFDFSMFFQRDGKRVPITVRYMALIDAASGNVDTAYWILDTTPEGYRFFGDSLHVLPKNHVMDWEMHCNGEEITFGAPNSETFTSTKLPEATARPVSAEFQEAAVARAFDTAGGARLEQQVRSIVGAK